MLIWRNFISQNQLQNSSSHLLNQLPLKRFIFLYHHPPCLLPLLNISPLLNMSPLLPLNVSLPPPLLLFSSSSSEYFSSPPPPPPPPPPLHPIPPPPPPPPLHPVPPPPPPLPLKISPLPPLPSPPSSHSSSCHVRISLLPLKPFMITYFLILSSSFLYFSFQVQYAQIRPQDISQTSGGDEDKPPTSSDEML